MARRYRTHLLFRGRTACRQAEVRSASVRPSEVTCVKCRRTIHMADAELRLVHNKLRTHLRKARR